MTTVDLPTVRQSALARFEDCPLSMRLGEQQERFSTHPLARGTAYHAFVAEVVAECMERKEPRMEPEEGRAIMARLVGESIEPIPDHERDSLLGLAWRFCRDRTFDLEHIVTTEETYSLAADGYVVTGKPDWVEIDGDVCTIRDHKTSFAMASERAHAIDAPDELDELESAEEEIRGGPFQLRLYALLVHEEYPDVERFRLVLDYPRWGEERTWVLERSDLRAVQEHLDSLLARLRTARTTDVYPASPGSWCATCPQPLECPIPAEHRGEGAIETPERAAAVATFLVSAEAICKDQKRALRAWCAENGPEPVGDLAFDFKLKAGSKKVRDRERLEEDMRAAGLDPDLYFTATKPSAEFKARKVTT